MAGEAKNLLTRTLATAAADDMQLYVVYNGHDYRILLSTLLALVTKVKLGLGNVDNTSDADKPVSNAVQTELDKKLNASDAVPVEEWNLFLNKFSGMMSAAELQAVISQLQQAVGGAVNATYLQQQITQALAPVNQTLTLLSSNYSNLQTAITAVTTEIADVSAALAAYILANDARVKAVEDRLTIIEENQLIFGPNFW